MTPGGWAATTCSCSWSALRLQPWRLHLCCIDHHANMRTGGIRAGETSNARRIRTPSSVTSIDGLAVAAATRIYEDECL